MKKLPIWLCITTMVASSFLWSMEESVEMMTFPITRALVKELGSGGGGYFDLRPLFALMVPGGFIADGALAACGAVSLPVMGTKSICAHMKSAWDKIPNLDETEKHAMAGYEQRMQDVASIIGDREVSLPVLQMLVFAGTAWDSKDCAPKKLILGTGQGLARNQLKEAPYQWVSLYDQLAQASQLAKEFDNKGELFNQLIDWSQSHACGKTKFPVNRLGNKLEQSSRTAQRILISFK